MMKRLLLLFAALLLVTVAACSTADRIHEEPGSSPASPTAASPAVDASPSASPSSSPEGQPLEALHVSFQLPAAWTIEGEEDSYAFKLDGTPVGGLDGLGYAESIDGLLPNGAIVDAQSELKGMPVKTVEAKLNLEGEGDDSTREEWHYFFFLPDEKAVYDLHFDAKTVKQDEARNIAQTAALK